VTASGPGSGRARATWIAAATWGIALLSYALLAHRLTAVLALEFETLAVNLSQDWAPGYPPPWWARRDWVPTGRALLLLGAAPLWVLVVARTLQGLLRRWAPASPLHVAHLPPWGRALAAAACGLPFAAFCGPFSLAVTMWISVEAFAWIQWYGNIDPALEWVRTHVPTAVLPASLVAGAFTLRLVLAPAGTAPGRLRWVRRLGWAAVLLPAAAVLLPTLVAAGPRAMRSAAAPGRPIFEQRCIGCHDRALTLYYVKTPAEWERTVTVQIEVEGVSLSTDERADLEAFLGGMRSYPDRWMVRTRCQRCHGLGARGWEDRTPEEWGRIVDRHARRSPYYYRPDVRTQIVADLSRAHGSETATVPPEVTEVDGTCGACHPVGHGADRWAGADERQVQALVDRMCGKMADPPVGDARQRLADEWAALIADPERMRTLLPHDLPVDEGRLRW